MIVTKYSDICKEDPKLRPYQQKAKREIFESLLKELGEPEFLIGDMASSAILDAYQKHLKESMGNE